VDHGTFPAPHDADCSLSRGHASNGTVNPLPLRLRPPPSALPRPVDPGETVEIEATVPGPPESGRFRLVFDLVAEQICRFEHYGSPGLALDLETKA
jgi:hypothetical protein